MTLRAGDVISAAVATGYLAGQTPRAGVTAGTVGDRVNEAENGALQRRIAISSTVTAPPKPTDDG